MNEVIGHFEKTNVWNGNIGLAAHNRGYPVNYFEHLKELKEKDQIIYTHNGEQRTYEIVLMDIIEETNWSYLEYTKENRITLITCVEDMPTLRRVVQGIEVK